jgi:hypothetical protein
VSESTEADHERIWLEPGGYGPEGRLWCQDNVWGSRCATEYVRADLMEAAIATARAEERERCAKIADEYSEHDLGVNEIAIQIAARIRSG